MGKNCNETLTYAFEITIGHPFDGLALGEDDGLHG